MCIKGKSHWILCLVMLNCLKPKQFQPSIHEFLICGSAYSVSQAGVCWEGRCHAEAVALWFSQLVFGCRGLHPWRCPGAGSAELGPRWGNSAALLTPAGGGPGVQGPSARCCANGGTAAPACPPSCHGPARHGHATSAAILLSWSPRSCG